MNQLVSYLAAAIVRDTQDSSCASNVTSAYWMLQDGAEVGPGEGRKALHVID
jgi:hypothetical protein